MRWIRSLASSAEADTFAPVPPPCHRPAPAQLIESKSQHPSTTTASLTKLLPPPSSLLVFSLNMAFSGALVSLTVVMRSQCLLYRRICLLTPVPQTITDLDDFLTPSQACIIPVRQTNKPASQADGRDPNVSGIGDETSIMRYTELTCL